jgi:hypothetical protein
LHIDSSPQEALVEAARLLALFFWYGSFCYGSFCHGSRDRDPRYLSIVFAQMAEQHERFCDEPLTLCFT